MKKLITLLMFVSLVSCNMNSKSQKRLIMLQLMRLMQFIILIKTKVALFGLVEKSQQALTMEQLILHLDNLSCRWSYFSGEFFVDMTSINVQDLTGGSKERLEGHLRSDDFFSVESFPSAHLYISSSELISDGKWMVNGFLTIKDISHPVLFEWQILKMGGLLTLFLIDQSIM